MTYKEYNEALQELSRQHNILKKNFIEEHKTYLVGERIKVVRGNGSEELGEVIDNELSWNGLIEPKMVKLKKDGTKGFMPLKAWSSDKIIKI